LAGTPVVHRNGQSTFAEYVAQDDLIDGVVIIKNGYIVFEAYPNMRPEQRHFAWSVTKVVTATALAVLVEQGKVEMTTPIDQYLPELADSSWAGVSVQNVADMASGINCLDSDGYQDPSTCIYTHEEALGITAPTGRDPKFIPHLQSMTRVTEPGTRYEYVSANTNVLALLIETITKKQFSDALAELVWRPIGAESDSLTAISKAGFAYGSGGLHARLRDIARFGQVFVQPDLADVLSPSTVRKIQLGGQSFTDHQIEDHQTTFGDDVPERAGWQWDMIWSDEAMYKSGYLGQGLYVDPSRDLVIAWFGTGLDYSEIENEMLPISRQIAHSMDKGKVP
jgi:CubicO group peptidase (beta-lactamase class C family)